MGRSRKSVRRKVSVKVSASKKKRKVMKTKAHAILPHEVREKLSIPTASGKKASKTQWDTKRTLKKNYEDNKVTMNVNMDIDEEVQEKKREKKHVEMLPKDVVDEINATCGKQRSTGRRPRMFSRFGLVGYQANRH